MRLKSAAEQLLRLRTKPHQCPRCDNAIFLLLLHTGLRVSELAALNRHQYRGEHLLDVKRKGKMRTAKIFLPREAKEALDAYLKDDRGDQDGPLLTTRPGARLTRQDIDWLLRGLAAQANATARDQSKRLALPAHTLRHTFPHKLAQERGVDFAMQASGHDSSGPLQLKC
jgi:integrase